jgi:hypothetical protein
MGSGNGDVRLHSRGQGSTQSRAKGDVSALAAPRELEAMLMQERPELELTAAQAVSKGQWSIASAYSEDPAAVQKDQISVLLDTAELGGVALSVGVVWWASRLTGVIGSFLASMPAWRELDPLPVLGRDEDEDQRWQADGEDLDAYADEVAISMFLDGTAPSSVAAA